MKQPKVAFFGGTFTETDKEEIAKTSEPYYFENDQSLEEVMFSTQPDILISIGQTFANCKKLLNLPLRDRRRWVRFEKEMSSDRGTYYTCL